MSSRYSISDETIADALAVGKTHQEAGVLAGCSARTVARRLDDPLFVRDVDRRRADLVGRVTGRLSELGHLALDVLAELMDDEKPAVRQRAAMTILSELPRFTRETDVERRLREVEGGATDGGDTVELDVEPTVEVEGLPFGDDRGDDDCGEEL